MTKADFIDKVADRSGLSKRDAASAVDAFLDSITDCLKSGEAVSFTGFGKFSPQQRKARQGVNPRRRKSDDRRRPRAEVLGRDGTEASRQGRLASRHPPFHQIAGRSGGPVCCALVTEPL